MSKLCSSTTKKTQCSFCKLPCHIFGKKCPVFIGLKVIYITYDESLTWAKKVGDPIFHLVENPSKILQHCLKDNDDNGIELERVKVPHEAHHFLIERCYYNGFF